VHSIKIGTTRISAMRSGNTAARNVIDIRSYYLDQDSGEFNPSRIGVTLGHADYLEVLSEVTERWKALGPIHYQV